MGRSLDTKTLDDAARYYAASFLQPDRAVDGRPVDGPQFVMDQFYAFTFKDEFDHMLVAVREWMSAKALKEFDRLAGSTFKPREEAVFRDLLERKLAVDMDGAHVPGRIGTTQLHGSRFVGTKTIEVEAPDSLRLRRRTGLDKRHRETHFKTVPVYWPVYAGEHEERLADSGVADPLPPGAKGLPLGATNTRISNEVALLACDSIVDQLDEGTGPAVISGRMGAQPADPDTAATGTLLFTLVCSATAFGAAADAAPGATATANAVTADPSADATGTLGYCRASAADTGPTIIDDHIDGEAGTSGADFNFNTLSIVSGATVSLSSWTVTMPES